MAERPAQPETTVALLTPLGAGGVAVVRVWGAGAAEVVRQLFAPTHRANLPEADRLAIGCVIDPATGEAVDEGLLLTLPAGLGFELSLHGGVRIVQRVVSACQGLGARRLDAGDEAGRDELWRQAAALHKARGRRRPALAADVELAMVSARTGEAVAWLAAQEELLGDAIERLAAAEQGGPAGRLAAGGQLRLQLERLACEADGWMRALAGVRVAIVGPPNAGKSTLLNALAGASTAIVSESAGTTRDYVTRWANLAGLACELVDTAGLRDGAGNLEAAAVALADPVVRSADLRVVVLDGGEELASGDEQRLAGLGGPTVVAINKCDRPVRAATAESAARLAGGGEVVRLVARTGEGLESLRPAVRRAVGANDLADLRAGLFCRRQRERVAGLIAGLPGGLGEPGGQRSATPATREEGLRAWVQYLLGCDCLDSEHAG
ncbi:MAG: tRNA modification GTPase MnmE [Phycisphaerae bacterium]|nr:tRNA modification GTPase MnmE [Phycisphaerae bacterium]